MEQPVCQATLLPTKANLTNLFVSLARLPSELILQGLEEEAAKVEQLLASIESALGNFPLSASNPFYIGLKVPEFEWENKVTKILQEYHTYVMGKMLEIISNVIPVTLSINVLGIAVDIVKIFTDKEYVQELKTQIADDIDAFIDSIESSFQTFTGRYGYDSLALKVEAVWSNFMSLLNGGLLNLLYDKLKVLISTFQSTWNSLGLPAIPDLTSIDIPGFIDSILNDLESTAEEKISQLENLTILGYNVLTMIGGEIQDKITNPERTIDRIVEAMRNFATDFPKKLILEWMDLVTSFFNAIGLSALVEWITFTFCDFMNLIGIPTTITLPEGVPEPV